MTHGTAVVSGRHPNCPVKLVARVPRPEYEYRSAMTSSRPVYIRASMTAVSTASVPLLVKKHLLRFPGAMLPSRRAASTWGSVTKPHRNARGGMRAVFHLVFEVEGAAKPAAVADVVYAYFP